MSFKNKRLRLYGKTSTKPEIAGEVSKLLLQGMGATEIKTRLDFASTKTVYNYKEFAISEGLLKLNQDGKPIMPIKNSDGEFKEFCDTYQETDDPDLKPWIQNLLLRKSGNPLTSWRSYVRTVIVTCNTLRIKPAALLQSLDASEKYLEDFLIIYKTGEAKTEYNADPQKVDMANVAYTYSKGIRDLMNFNNMRYPKGKTGVMSQKVPNHAKYADIRLKEDELQEAKRYLIDKYGLDSDEVRLIFVAIESCSRAGALLGMNLDFEKHVSPKTHAVTYIMKAYESKTKQIRGGLWRKFIRWPETQKSIDLLKARGGTKLFESKEVESRVEDNLKKVSIDLFVHLGKIPNLDELKAMRKAKILNTGNYYFDHPIHVFRHIGAHYWLNKKKYNYGLVGELGGWHTIDELKTSYGEMPYEVILSLLEDEN